MNGRLGAAFTALAIGATLVAPGAWADSGEVTVYKSPSCGCCGGWVDHMRQNGFSVTVKEMDDVEPIKDFLRIDDDLRSCHTATLDGYALEGHVTLAAIRKLLAERPKVRGIALPGMPEGSPGMGGEKSGPFTTMTISDSAPTVFLTE
ncbi:MAG: DUF411 domain-containing protein [Rhodospirillales bacterium]|jgi:hypothetical protein|nr:DUF411 domain-containing protein [Rhodospirillales bacterium]